MAHAADNSRRARPEAKAQGKPAEPMVYRIRDYVRLFDPLPRDSDPPAVWKRYAAAKLYPVTYWRFYINTPPCGFPLRRDWEAMKLAIRAAGGFELQGVWTELVSLSADQIDHRGCLLDRRGQPASPIQIAALLGLPPRRTSHLLELLCSREVDVLELVPWAIAQRDDQEYWSRVDEAVRQAGGTQTDTSAPDAGNQTSQQPGALHHAQQAPPRAQEGSSGPPGGGGGSQAPPGQAGGGERGGTVPAPAGRPAEDKTKKKNKSKEEEQERSRCAVREEEEKKKRAAARQGQGPVSAGAQEPPASDAAADVPRPQPGTGASESGGQPTTSSPGPDVGRTMPGLGDPRPQPGTGASEGSGAASALLPGSDVVLGKPRRGGVVDVEIEDACGPDRDLWAHYVQQLNTDWQRVRLDNTGVAMARVIYVALGYVVQGTVNPRLVNSELTAISKEWTKAMATGLPDSVLLEVCEKWIRDAERLQQIAQKERWPQGGRVNKRTGRTEGNVAAMWMGDCRRILGKALVEWAAAARQLAQQQGGQTHG